MQRPTGFSEQREVYSVGPLLSAAQPDHCHNCHTHAGQSNIVTFAPQSSLDSTVQDHELVGRSGHGDVVVYGSFDAGAEVCRVDQDDQIKFQSLGQLRCQESY